eukprot:scaffold1496_cov110-Isochrysis_galbana.AAC.19
MAPRQLTLPPMEVDMNLEPGSQRARPSNAEKSSMQVRLRACASACGCGTSWPVGLRTGWHCWHFPGPIARACRSWQGKSVLQRLF